MLIVATSGHVGGSGIDGLRNRAIEQLQAGVGTRRGLLHQRQRADESARQWNSADGEILHGALGLRTPERISGDLQLTHAVALDPKRIRHESTPLSSCVIMQIVALRGFPYA